MVMPRPDLEAIGVGYRRIPVMAIGKDVYCDTRIILRKLEEFFPHGKIGASSPDGYAIQKLIEIWHVEGPLFSRAASSMPLSVFKDAKFAKDRGQMTGRPWNMEVMEKFRPDALAYVRSAFSFLEKLLADGRQWIISTSEPSLADIEAIFVVHWLNGMKGALPEDLVSQAKYPKVFAWIGRFDNALKTAQAKAPKPTKLDGATAAKQVFESGFAEKEGTVEVGEFQKELRQGDQVEVFPTDSGMHNKDSGRLLSLTEDEIVIDLENGLRLHTPRAGFRVKQLGSKL